MLCARVDTLDPSTFRMPLRGKFKGFRGTVFAIDARGSACRIQERDGQAPRDPGVTCSYLPGLHVWMRRCSPKIPCSKRRGPRLCSRATRRFSSMVSLVECLRVASPKDRADLHVHRAIRIWGPPKVSHEVKGSQSKLFIARGCHG